MQKQTKTKTETCTTCLHFNFVSTDKYHVVHYKCDLANRPARTKTYACQYWQAR